MECVVSVTHTSGVHLMSLYFKHLNTHYHSYISEQGYYNHIVQVTVILNCSDIRNEFWTCTLNHNTVFTQEEIHTFSI